MRQNPLMPALVTSLSTTAAQFLPSGVTYVASVLASEANALTKGDYAALRAGLELATELAESEKDKDKKVAEKAKDRAGAARMLTGIAKSVSGKGSETSIPTILVQMLVPEAASFEEALNGLKDAQPNREVVEAISETLLPTMSMLALQFTAASTRKFADRPDEATQAFLASAYEQLSKWKPWLGENPKGFGETLMPNASARAVRYAVQEWPEASNALNPDERKMFGQYLRVKQDLFQELEHEADPESIAERMRKEGHTVDLETVVLFMEIQATKNTISIFEPLGGSEDATLTLADTLAAPDIAELFEQRQQRQELEDSSEEDVDYLMTIKRHEDRVKYLVDTCGYKPLIANSYLQGLYNRQREVDVRLAELRAVNGLPIEMVTQVEPVSNDDLLQLAETRRAQRSARRRVDRATVVRAWCNDQVPAKIIKSALGHLGIDVTDALIEKTSKQLQKEAAVAHAA